MALAGETSSSALGIRLKENEDLSLLDIVKSFNSPINEEQAWAVCYQCTLCFIRGISEKEYLDFCQHGGNALRIGKEGSVFFDSCGSGKGPPRTGTGTEESSSLISHHKALENLGLAIFQALDYGLKEHEERHLSQSLESLIELMTSPDDNNDDIDYHEAHSIDDEGIENDVDDEDEKLQTSQGQDKLHKITKMCADRLSSPQNAGHHYKAVCRALVAEVIELVSFLDEISYGDQKVIIGNSMQEITLDELQRDDWARLWVQIMRQLRHGVKLKKVEHAHLPPLEYELTPYEVLMEDIRSRRYTLNKIMINGDIPPKVKNDANEVILNFIRSRPPLIPVKDRVLRPAAPKRLNTRERLLDEIRKQPQLKPLESEKPKRFVEKSRTRLFDDDSDTDSEDDRPTIPIRTLIKPDLSLLCSSFEFDEEDEDHDLTNQTTTDEEEEDDRTRIEPVPMSPLSPISMATPDSISTHSFTETVVQDLITSRSASKLSRRHSITVCESPAHTKVSGHLRGSTRARPRLQKHDSIPEHDETDDSTDSCGTLMDKACARSSPVAERKFESSSNVCSNFSCCSEHAKAPPENGLAQLNASELLHVSWKTECPRKSSSHPNAPCQDCRPVPKKWQNPMECLSLTIEEVMHIRTVLTKAELESLMTQPQIYSQIIKGKLCFTCKQTKFSLFGQWGTKCRFCQRSVCNKCLRKIHVPKEHFGKIPVYTLSPSPLSPEGRDLLARFAGTGSKPPSPLVMNKPFISPGMIAPPKRRPLTRSHTITSRPPSAEVLRGPQMSVCCECKNMVCEIIRVSRMSVTLASHGNDWQPEHGQPSRNLHLNLKPI